MNTIQSELQKLQPINLDAGLIFSGKKSGTIVKGYEKPTAFTPKINSNYVFHESVRDLVVWFIAMPTPIYVCGAAGSGKSSSINQLAARLNYPVFEVTGHNRLEFQDLIGHHTVEKQECLQSPSGLCSLGFGRGVHPLPNRARIRNPALQGRVRAWSA